jgi:hypothetical protein
MTATLTQPTRQSDSERLRRRRDRHARLETDRVMTEVAFELRARERHDRGLDLGVGHELEVHDAYRPSGALPARIRVREEAECSLARAAPCDRRC